MGPDELVRCPRKLHEHHAHEGRYRKIEGELSLRGGQRRDVVDGGLVDNTKRHARLGLGDGHRSVRTHVEARPQGAVPCNHRVERLLQRVRVQRSIDAHAELRHVNGSAFGVEALEEHPGLQRRWRVGACVGRGPSALWQWRAGLCGHTNLGDAANGLVFEDLLGAQLKALLSRARHELQARDGVSSQLEEVVVDGDVAPTGERANDRCDGLLRRGHGSVDLGSHGAKVSGSWKAPAVDLPALLRGQRVKHDDPRRHHVRRQLAPRMGAKARFQGTLALGASIAGARIALVQHHVGHQQRCGPKIVADAGDCRAHIGMGHDRVFDLGELHPLASKLHLLVGTAQDFQASVWQPASLVAGAKASVGGKAKRGGGTCADVPEGDADAAKDDLARRAEHRRVLVRIEHIDIHVGQGRPHGDPLAMRVCRGHLVHGCAHGCFGGPVGVEQAHVRNPAPCQIRRQRFARRNHGTQRRQGLRIHESQKRRRERHARDVAISEDATEVFFGQGPGRAKVERRAALQRHENLGDRRVEAKRGHLEDPVVGAKGEALGLRHGEVYEPAMRYAYALRSAR